MAETVLALVIIGILSVVVVPSLIYRIETTQNRILLKEAASILSHATRQITVENGGTLVDAFISRDGHTISADAMLRYSNYINFTKTCLFLMPVLLCRLIISD